MCIAETIASKKIRCFPRPSYRLQATVRFLESLSPGSVPKREQGTESPEHRSSHKSLKKKAFQDHPGQGHLCPSRSPSTDYEEGWRPSSRGHTQNISRTSLVVQ
ncbi:unnamed protein product [Rangifer tarandus platyrhynchus]|uniref:Uncharacterized protein n=2 Tax=Rangifer tarandus platyrhynchus TaxID=3082113 RepID=A0AC60A7P4_RANTA|nr:unnamed protein product [Rangifer tarandus platyrhynchus]